MKNDRRGFFLENRKKQAMRVLTILNRRVRIGRKFSVLGNPHFGQRAWHMKKKRRVDKNFVAQDFVPILLGITHGLGAAAG